MSKCIRQSCDNPPAFGAFCIDHVDDEYKDVGIVEAAFRLRDARKRMDDARGSNDHYGRAQLREQEGRAGRALDKAVDMLREIQDGKA
jgi:hypothetical protein